MKQDTPKLAVRITPALFKRFRAEVDRRGMKVQAAAEQAIRLWLEKEGSR